MAQRDASDRPPAPLSGVRVVDFARIVSGPFAAQILGDLGADVVKVEFVGTGDEVRSYGVRKSLGPRAGSTRPGATFLALNRNKRSVAVDVRSEQGREVALRLIARSDVVLENFRTGVMDRLGLGYDSVRERNPGVVYCSISGFGRVGPLAEAPANDLAVQAYTGLLSITGEPSGPPVRVPTPVCDMTAGLFAVIGILAALNRRRDTGQGQYIATNMFEGQLNMLGYMFIDYWVNGRVPEKLGTRNRMGQPNQAFPTRDGWVCVVAANESSWVRCCEALGVPELAFDDRFRTLADRATHVDELSDAVGAATSAFTTEECVRRLQEARVVCAPVNTIPQLTSHPQLAAVRDAGGIVEMPVGELGPVPLIMTPIHLSDTPVAALRPPPTLGQHTDDVLSDLGFTPEEIAVMRAEGTVE
jgi:crotonobetainyl-CoA:carnitine CoA-transferase CaiB-like acyl-CoA transferase